MDMGPIMQAIQQAQGAGRFRQDQPIPGMGSGGNASPIPGMRSGGRPDYRGQMAEVQAQRLANIPTETPDMQDSGKRQMRRLGLAMMANSGTGIAGVGQAGLGVMEQNDADQAAEAEYARANAEKMDAYLSDLAAYLKGEREYDTGRRDKTFEQDLKRDEYTSGRYDANRDHDLARDKLDSLDAYRQRPDVSAGKRYLASGGGIFDQQTGKFIETPANDKEARTLAARLAQDAFKAHNEFLTPGDEGFQSMEELYANFYQMLQTDPGADPLGLRQ